MIGQGRRTGGVLPLDQYAALGDGRSVALVGSDGSIDWWCVPNLDSTALFDRLLDEVAGGRFALTPVTSFSVQRRYLPDSNVLEQTYTTATGIARITDSLNGGSAGRLPWNELARRVEGLEGIVAFEFELSIGRRQGRATPWQETTTNGIVFHMDGLIAALRSDARLDALSSNDRGMCARITARAGARTIIAMLATARSPLILAEVNSIDARIDRTDRAWREWAGNLNVDGAYASQLRRSALALKLLVFAPTGSIAAAATTSLPERAGGDKNYDYRYAWVRDAAYSIKAFLRVGAMEEATAAFAWLTQTITRHEGGLRTMYRLDGSLSPEEHVADVPGYANSRPVRVGNRARDQVQLGVFGDLLETAALLVDLGHVFDLVTRRLLGDLADRCADLWESRDAGMWELEQEEHYTMSKMSCWTALDRAAALAEHGHIDTSHRQRWLSERDRIREWVDTHCWSDRKQAYTLHAGSERLDAALLLATRFGFPRHDRLAATRDAVIGELGRGPNLYRYSGMEAEEGTFIACGFWLVEAYALLGERPAAVQQMTEMLSACGNNLGLLSEQLDCRDASMLGNLPQALSHLALIHAAMAIAETA